MSVNGSPNKPMSRVPECSGGTEQHGTSMKFREQTAPRETVIAGGPGYYRTWLLRCEATCSIDRSAGTPVTTEISGEQAESSGAHTNKAHIIF